MENHAGMQGLEGLVKENDDLRTDLEAKSLEITSLELANRSLLSLLRRRGEFAILGRWDRLGDNIESVVRYYGLVASKSSEDDYQFSDVLKVVNKQGVCRSAQALVFVAVALWVFNSEFPDFDPHKNVILEEYRKVFLSEPGGIVGVRATDLVLHRGLIEGEDFEKSMKRKEAAKLALKLWNFLLLFLPPDVVKSAVDKAEEDQNNAGDSTDALGASDLDNVPRDRIRLIGLRIFGPLLLSALTLKTDMVTCYSLFEIVFFTSGSTFDPEVMETTTITATESNESTSRQPIGFCRAPALVMHHGPEDTTPQNPGAPDINRVLESARAQTRIPITFASEWKACPGMVIKKAVVH